MRKTELPNCPQWLLEAETWDEDVSFNSHGVLQWKAGDFIRGNFRGGTFLGGDFWGGNFLGGDFRGGDFRGGNFRGGDFLGGNFRGGTFLGGNFRGERAIFSGSFGPAPSSARMVYAILTPSHQMVRAGCFCGTIEQMRQAAKLKHADNYHARLWYLGIFDYLDGVLSLHRVVSEGVERQDHTRNGGSEE